MVGLSAEVEESSREVRVAEVGESAREVGVHPRGVFGGYCCAVDAGCDVDGDSSFCLCWWRWFEVEKLHQVIASECCAGLGRKWGAVVVSGGADGSRGVAPV